MKENFKNLPLWMITLIVIVSGFFLFAFLLKESPGEETVSEDKIGSLVVDYIDEMFLQGQVPIELVDVSEESGVYVVKVRMSENQESGEEFDVYATKDGKYLFPEGYNMEEKIDLFDFETPNEEEPQEPEAAPTNMDSFIACLNQKSFKIYGANWCPYCASLVDMFGGYEKAESIYVECTEEQDICEENKITAYPTILIAGEEYQGARTFQQIALKTDCEM